MNMKASVKYTTSEHVFLADFFSKTYKIQFLYTKSFSNNMKLKEDIMRYINTEKKKKKKLHSWIDPWFPSSYPLIHPFWFPNFTIESNQNKGKTVSHRNTKCCLHTTRSSNWLWLSTSSCISPVNCWSRKYNSQRKYKSTDHFILMVPSSKLVNK